MQGAIGGDLIGVGTAIAGVADEANQIIESFDKPIYSVTEIKRRYNTVTIKKTRLSILNITFITAFASLIAEAIRRRAAGEEYLYEAILEEMKDLIAYMRELSPMPDIGDINPSGWYPGKNVMDVAGGIWGMLTGEQQREEDRKRRREEDKWRRTEERRVRDAQNEARRLAREGQRDYERRRGR